MLEGPILISCNLFSLKLLVIFGRHKQVHEFELHGDKKTQKVIIHLLVHSKIPTTGKLDKAEDRTTELNPGLSHGWQELKYLGHKLLPPRCISKKLDEYPNSNRTLRYVVQVYQVMA